MAEPCRYYTINTLAERWGVSPRTVRKLVNSGELPHIRIGSLIRIRPDQVQEYERKKTENTLCQDQETPVCDLISARSARLTTSAITATEEVKGSLLGQRIAQVLS